MKLVSLTIPKPTLINEDEIRSVSLTIKSKNNGIQVIDSWPFALPRYKYESDEILEISIYYILKSKVNSSGSEEINLYSVIYFPCILLKDTDINGKKQWILGLEKFDETSNFLTEINTENALKQIRLMEEKARKSFKISKIYLIFYSCNRTVMNIEEQLNNYNLKDQNFFSEKIISLEGNKKKDNNEKLNKSYLGIRPEDSISRISGRTNSTNNIMRTNLIKQNLSENCDNLSDAIEMINKYRNKSKCSPLSMKINENNQKDNILNYNTLNLMNNKKLMNDVSKPNSKIIENHHTTDNEEVNIDIKNIKNDTTSIISKAISSNTKKLLEKKITQERLLILQYYFSIWRQKTYKQIDIKTQKNNNIKIKCVHNLLKLFEKIENRNKLYFLNLLWKNNLRISNFNKNNEQIKKYKFENQQLNNEKTILIEKLNTIVVDNHSKQQILKENILSKDKEVFELKKKLEFIDNLNNELNAKLINKNNENEKLIKQLKELKSYLGNTESIMENDKNKYLKEKQDLENIVEKRKKENSRQAEEIIFLNTEINELRNALNTERDNKNTYLKLNDELNHKYKIVEDEKVQLVNKLNENIYSKNKENEELKLENIKYKENNDLLLKNNNKLLQENNNYKLICDELLIEKNSLINSVYDLINQIENEKIERIQELENSRILFQSINNSNHGNILNINNIVSRINCREEDNYDDYDNFDDLKLEDLRNTYDNKAKFRINNLKVVKNINNITILDHSYDIKNNTYGKYILLLINEYKLMQQKILTCKSRKLSKININKIQIENKTSCQNLSIKKELKFELFDEINNELFKEKNEKILDLSERVKILSDEMKKLKDNELIKENNPIASEYFNKNFSLDDTEKIVSSATEMFMLALKNIKLNNEKVVIENKEDRNQIIIPSEFSFNINNNSLNNKDDNIPVNTAEIINNETKYKNQQFYRNYHQYNVDNNYNQKKMSYNKLLSSSTITTSSSVSPSIVSPIIQYKDSNQFNKLKNQVMQIPSSPSPPSPMLSRSNSMRQNFNNNNINGFYYQCNSIDYGNFVPKRYNSLPKQPNNAYQIRTIPPPFFPKS